MKKLTILCVVAIALVAGACSSDENHDEVLASIVDALETESIGEDPIFEITSMQCVAERAVDELGADPFEIAGAPEGFDPTALPVEDQEVLARAYVDCVDVGDVFSDIVSAEDMPFAIANCIEEQLEDDDVQVVMVQASWVETEEEASVAAITVAFERCLEG